MKGNSKNLPHDTKHNTGNLGAMQSKLHPNQGTRKLDKQDNVKNPAAKKAFKAKLKSDSSNPR